MTCATCGEPIEVRYDRAINPAGYRHTRRPTDTEKRAMRLAGRASIAYDHDAAPKN